MQPQADDTLTSGSSLTCHARNAPNGDRSPEVRARPPEKATPPGVLLGDYAVNTIQPRLQPYSPTSTPSQRLPMLHTEHRRRAHRQGRELDAVLRPLGQRRRDHHRTGVDQRHHPRHLHRPQPQPGRHLPYCADKLFRYHYQPFNFYADYAHGSPGRAHLQDEAAFPPPSRRRHPPAVSFVRPSARKGASRPRRRRLRWPAPSRSHQCDQGKRPAHHGNRGHLRRARRILDHVPPPTAPGVSDQLGPSESQP